MVFGHPCKRPFMDAMLICKMEPKGRSDTGHAAKTDYQACLIGCGQVSDRSTGNNPKCNELRAADCGSALHGARVQRRIAPVQR